MKIRLLVVCVLLFAGLCSATTRYVAQSAGVFSGGTACNGQTAVTPATWNATTLVAGDVSYVCGTITGSAGATPLIPHNGGSSGNPIVINFDTGAILQAPYCSGSNGCLDIHGLSNVTIDGQNTGTIQNTASRLSEPIHPQPIIQLPPPSLECLHPQSVQPHLRLTLVRPRWTIQARVAPCPSPTR